MDQVDPETLGARLAHANRALTRGSERQYVKIRLLENAIRKHATHACKCTSPHQCLVELHTLVPNQARPTLREAQKKARKQ